MKDEIKEGVEFLRQFLAKYGQLTQVQIDIIAVKLTNILEKRYVNHWYENNPMKGQAFRCLRLKHSENYIDPVLDQILKEMNLSLNQLGLPNDFTLWIDPGEVSVRFGDQVGYTYSIARLNREPNDLVNSNIENDNNNNNNNEHFSNNISQLVSNQQTSSFDQSPKSTLIVENSANIFDEKLTAFIRQNSCSTNQSDQQQSILNSSIPLDLEFNINNNNTNINDFDDLNTYFYEDLISTIQQKQNPNELFLMSQLTNQLSADKRTISPPTSPNKSGQQQQQNQNKFSKSNLIKRTNSSSINIKKNNLGMNNNDLFESNIDKQNQFLTSLITNNNGNNRLSYNDSCYYSSSSSSCSSSFESNVHEDSNLNWTKILEQKNQLQHQQQQQQQQQQSQQSLNFNSLNPSSTLIANNNDFDLNNQQSSFSNSLSLFSSPLFEINNNYKNLRLFGNQFVGTYGLFDNNNNNKIYNGYPNFSDNSSDRSDTPSSCITTASSASFFMTPSPSSFSNFNLNNNSLNTNNNSNNILGDNYVKQLNRLSINEEPVSKLMPISSSNSSGSTTVASSNETKLFDDSETLKSSKLISNESDNDETNTVKDGDDKNKFEENSLSKNDSNQKQQQQPKKDDKYCGYVESFPYYYKLNRLYNALAVQKMQTERMKKNATIINNSSPNTPAAIAAALAALSTSPNAASIGQAQLRNLTKNPNSNTSSPVGASPSNYTSSLATTPPPQSNQQHNQAKSMLNSTSSTSINLIGNNTNRPSSLLQNNQSKNYQNNNRNNNNKNGFPMSPTNAAISFANHQAKNSKNNHQFNNNMKTTNIQYNKNSSKLFQNNVNYNNKNYSTTNNNNNNNNNNTNNLFNSYQLLQQQQQQQQHSSPQQFINQHQHYQNQQSQYHLHQHQQQLQQQQQQQQQNQNNNQNNQQQSINQFYPQLNWNRGQDLLKS